MGKILIFKKNPGTKGFSTFKCNVGNWKFSKACQFFGRSLGIIWEFFANSLKIHSKESTGFLHFHKCPKKSPFENVHKNLPILKNVSTIYQKSLSTKCLQKFYHVKLYPTRLEFLASGFFLSFLDCHELVGHPKMTLCEKG